MSGEGKGGAEALADGRITIVTQTRVRPEDEKTFAEWQDGTSRTIAGFPGFLHQTVMPPTPPAQVDWVILQRFADIDSATAWLRSVERQERLVGVRPMLIGQDDVHLLREGASRAQPSEPCFGSVRAPPCGWGFDALWPSAGERSRRPGPEGATLMTIISLTSSSM